MRNIIKKLLKEELLKEEKKPFPYKSIIVLDGVSKNDAMTVVDYLTELGIKFDLAGLELMLEVIEDEKFVCIVITPKGEFHFGSREMYDSESNNFHDWNLFTYQDIINAINVFDLNESVNLEDENAKRKALYDTSKPLPNVGDFVRFKTPKDAGMYSYLGHFQPGNQYEVVDIIRDRSGKYRDGPIKDFYLVLGDKGIKLRLVDWIFGDMISEIIPYTDMDKTSEFFDLNESEEEFDWVDRDYNIEINIKNKTNYPIEQEIKNSLTEWNRTVGTKYDVYVYQIRGTVDEWKTRYEEQIHYGVELLLTNSHNVLIQDEWVYYLNMEATGDSQFVNEKKFNIRHAPSLEEALEFLTESLYESQM